MTKPATRSQPRASAPATETTARDWVGARGAKWLAQLPGLEATLAPVDQPLIRALELSAPCRIADIGCGGGGTTFAILREAPRGSVVHGFDLSPGIIELARQRVGTEGDGVAFETADVSTAPAPAEPYDRLVARFGIMFFADPQAALSNVSQWLSPGGRFAFAVWGPLADNPWLSTAREVVAEVAPLPALDPEMPGPFRYAEPQTLLPLLKRAGFAEPAVQTWRGSLPIGGGLPAAAAADFALASFSSFSELLAEAGDDAFQRARRSLTSRWLQHEQDNVVRLSACVHIVVGARSGSAR